MEEDVKNGIFLYFRNVQISERLLHILPYRYGANGDLGIIEVTSEDNENHHVPSSKQSMTAEARESRTKAQISLMANHESPRHPSLHQTTT